jgi:predicted nucleic acid-binding protein
MTEKIVVNTSPLLSLAKMQALDAVGKLPFEFVCPAEVEAEILAGVNQGYDVEIPAWLSVVSLKKPLSPLAVASLDEGEAAVIQLALENNISLVCIDELKGRRAALAVGLKVVGSLGLLGKAKTLGLILTIRPFIEKAKNTGIYYDDHLIETFLKSLGE